MDSSSSENIDQLIISLQDVLKQFPYLKLGLLFGSMATGKNHSDSDLDLAVLANQPLTAKEIMAIIAALANKIGQPVDLIDLKKISEPLLGQILKHGKRIFGSNTDYAQLITRHVFEKTDFMPYRERILDERKKNMDRQVVNIKLESLRRCLKRLTAKCPPEPEILVTDIYL